MKPICAILALGMTVCGGAIAETKFPQNQVTLIVPQSPGGASDVLARILAEKLAGISGQPVVVENRAGAGGNIGLGAVSKAAPDGYTLLLSYEGTQAINASLYRKLSYDPIKDFVPVATVATVPFVLVVNNDVKATTFQEFVALAKTTTGMTFGSAGNGSVNHLLGEMVNLSTGTRLTHVPYKGAGAAMTDLLGKRIDAVFTSYPSIAPQISAHSVRALAVTSAARATQLPELPTIAEAGFPGFDVNPWFGLFAPAGTPEEIVDKINTDVAALLKDPEVAGSFSKQGATPLQSTPSEFKHRLASDSEKWRAVVTQAGARVD
ncbi:tripartite tricarboxylate transporter substrate binding protein [Achromobacter spanius]|uniref:Bug family tripartite tricarboxylate transporter substrate binding protein n=1 Tax=Achromobacter spanius TaxID=217203 RepID=UPI0032097671